jgi:NADH:ubiquinone oxidoreductase subunit 4 (subunit M)
MMGFSVIALPLGLGFASEDLIVHALLEHAHWLGLFHILAGCLNGILIYQLFAKLFLGTAKIDIPQANFDLPYRRLIPYYLVLVFIIATGLAPQWVINLVP